MNKQHPNKMHGWRKETQAGGKAIFLGEMTLEKRYILSRGVRKDRKWLGIINGNLLKLPSGSEKTRLVSVKISTQYCSMG